VPDPGSSDSNAFAAALAWLEGALFGTVGTAIAVIAIASIGFLMMAGRIDLRRAVQVVLGCFILFGASSIAGRILSAVHGQSGADPVAALRAPPPAPLPPTAPAANSNPYDPYAGAALPPR
jgi:type IV secretory pathway VirB2 component (pilin)